MKYRKAGQLAPVGSTATGAYPSVMVDADFDTLSLEFEVTAVGTTVTPKFQGSMDPVEITDANSDWFDLAVLPPAAAAETTTPAAVTTVSVNEYAVDPERHPVVKVRLNITANTGCTFEAEAFGGVDV